LTGTRRRLSGFSQPRQCGDDVLRMLVTGGPPNFGGGGIPLELTTIVVRYYCSLIGRAGKQPKMIDVFLALAFWLRLYTCGMRTKGQLMRWLKRLWRQIRQDTKRMRDDQRAREWRSRLFKALREK
jgi:hypothetical protein